MYGPLAFTRPKESWEWEIRPNNMVGGKTTIQKPIEKRGHL